MRGLSINAVAAATSTTNSVAVHRNVLSASPTLSAKVPLERPPKRPKPIGSTVIASGVICARPFSFSIVNAPSVARSASTERVMFSAEGVGGTLAWAAQGGRSLSEHAVTGRADSHAA